MSESLDTFDTEKARQTEELAAQCLSDLCQAKRRWEMHIPLRNDDPDVLLGDALGQLRSAIKEVERLRQHAEAVEQWRTEVPWPALRMVLDAAFQFAQGNDELWADCEQVQTWADDHEIGDESCVTIHPETWQGAQP